MERERVRNLLLSSISHDFRSPLAAISGAADTIAERYAPADAAACELLDSIRDQSNRLSRLVRNVLDLTRLEAGESKLKLGWESIEEIVGSALSRTAALLGSRQIDVKLSADLPLVEVDAVLMEQVFINIFENIAKHTPEKTAVLLTASVRENNLQVIVSDTGPGLPVGAEERIFEKAFRGTTTEEGFGLGLTICQAVMKAHNGRIAASNNALGGAQFEIFLPLPAQQPEIKHDT